MCFFVLIIILPVIRSFPSKILIGHDTSPDLSSENIADILIMYDLSTVILIFNFFHRAIFNRG